MDVIDCFKGEYAFLSNFYPVNILYDGYIWPSVEHLYQGYKTENMELRERILHAPTPAEAKRLGGYKVYQGDIVIRKGWPTLKQRYMKIGIDLKFDPIVYPELVKKLIATYNKDIREGNTWHDNFWGECICEKCQSNRKVVGQNWLGYFLKEKRKQLMEMSEKYV